MKLILSFLFTFSLIFNLTAQTTNSKTIFSGSILSGSFVQNESFYADAAYSSISEEYEYIADLRNKENRLLLALGVQKINTKMNRFAFNIFAGRQVWERGNVVFIEDEELEIAVGVPLFTGDVEQYTMGLNATQSFCVNKKVESDFRVYLGARGEGMYTYGDYGVGGSSLNTIATAPFGRQTYRHKIEFVGAFVPELVYYFPNNQLSLSLAAHLPMVLIDRNSKVVEAANSFQDDEKSSYSGFHIANWQASRLEFGFGWAL